MDKSTSTNTDVTTEDATPQKNKKANFTTTVKFETPNGEVFTHAFDVDFTISSVKHQLEGMLGVPCEKLLLLHYEELVADDENLENLKPDQYGILKLKILTEGDTYTINVHNVYKDLTVPDIITVHVDTEDEGGKDVVVEIENRAIQKPNLGGYRHVTTGVKYFHGYTQTGPLKPKVPPEMKNHRDTQTYFIRHRRTDMEYSRATQVATKDIYIPNLSDRIITSGPYETADEREKRLDVIGKVRTIQRYYRVWKLRKAIKELSEEYRKRVRLQKEQEERERREDEERRKRDIISKVFPITPTDFAMLYTLVDRWKNAELARISATHCGPSKIAEFYLVLDKEVDILRSIQNIRNKVAKDLEIKKTLDFFKSIGTPVEWYSEYKHLHIVMDTLETQRGREYFALYKDLTDKTLSREAKLEMYLRVKEYLNTHACDKGRQIIVLIDRACELLVRGMDQKYLESLHMRIEAMVVRHFQTPECNEGVTAHVRNEQERNMEKNLLYCHRCQKLKTIEKFTLNARMDAIKICSSCRWLDKAEEPWIDLAPYRFILRQIRNYERLHKATSSVAFILQDKDIHYIMTYIWHGHSALSESTDLYKLRLCRWKVQEEWSPWNCILLTVEEARAHLDIKNLEDVYEEEFINHVFNKHALAKKHFSQLVSYDKHFAEFAGDDPRLDDDSDFYKGNEADCLFGPIE
ncbi:hypothetical protein NQ315_013110 [Exocentrus adspersus]|uniref:IQ motif and ubiquitin-like domain-containing protein n=1 Tax=Exocentrus adspersus TaxID=1586481 RepID=A0AAV8VXC6_9CUCU|nr:hypothetical protein NQ315_013110 [Exocentrus adspersus]